MSNQLTKVDKTEFDDFMKNYPRPVERGVTTICEPPIGHAHDKTLLSKSEIGTREYFDDTEVARWRPDWDENYKEVGYFYWIRKS